MVLPLGDKFPARVLDALQTDRLCPCDWQEGEEVLRPAA